MTNPPEPDPAPLLARSCQLVDKEGEPFGSLQVAGDVRFLRAGKRVFERDHDQPWLFAEVEVREAHGMAISTKGGTHHE